MCLSLLIMALSLKWKLVMCRVCCGGGSRLVGAVNIVHRIIRLLMHLKKDRHESRRAATRSFIS